MRCVHAMATAAIATLALTTAVSAQVTTFVETFEDGLNAGAWSWGTGNESIVALNGNPGAYLQDLTLATCCPAAGTAFGQTSVYTGDYRSRHVSSLGIDLVTLDTDFGIGERPLSVLLINDAGTPFDLNDDFMVYFVGDTSVPQAGVISRAPTGWTSYDFAIPSQATSLPTGWAAYSPTNRPANQVWNDVITDVDVVQFFYGDPADIFLFLSWDVGLDNPRITYGQPADALPALVTFDDGVTRGWTILGWDDEIWQAEGGNPGAQLNFVLDNFFIRIYNRTDPAFIGDYSLKGSVEISADLRWRLINFFGTDVQRDLFFMIWDEYVDDSGVPRKHVLLKPLGKVRGQGQNAPWKTSRVRLPDPSSTTLPGGWYYWPFDAGIEPSRTLPPGVTVADIMSSVDRVQWSTATPGLFFGFTFFDVSLDNVAIRQITPGGRRLSLTGTPLSASAELTYDGGLTVSPSGSTSPVSDLPTLSVYLDLWASGAPLADYTTTGAATGTWGFGIGDNVVDMDDLTYFLEMSGN